VRKRSVLILCTGNSARSQIAETLLRHLSRGSVDVASAGSAPQPEIHPMARQAVRNVLGIEMEGQRTKSLQEFLGRSFDDVITVCDRAAEGCPVFPGSPRRIHWSVEDPAAAIGTPVERQQAFDAVARELEQKLRTYLTEFVAESV
jgi:protein-tyrosine-phosphatase